MKKSFRALIAAALCLTATAPQAATFNIQVVFAGGLTLSQRNTFAQAETYWESVITGYQAGISIPSLVITAFGDSIDLVGNILGGAAPTAFTTQAGYYLPTAGLMVFDIADMPALELNGSFLDVIKHEMAHVMGFGTTWTDNGVYVDEFGRFTGANALAAYRAEFDAGALFVPVDIVSGQGTRNGHWDEDWEGGPFDLMTGFLNTPTFTSNTTIQSFVDIGYSTAPVPLPAGAVLLLGGLGIMGAVGARRRRT